MRPRGSRAHPVHSVRVDADRADQVAARVRLHHRRLGVQQRRARRQRRRQRRGLAQRAERHAAVHAAAPHAPPIGKSAGVHRLERLHAGAPVTGRARLEVSRLRVERTRAAERTRKSPAAAQTKGRARPRTPRSRCTSAGTCPRSCAATAARPANSPAARAGARSPFPETPGGARTRWSRMAVLRRPAERLERPGCAFAVDARGQDVLRDRGLSLPPYRSNDCRRPRYRMRPSEPDAHSR